jgi:ketosteroid isomerase-like protein
MTGYWLLFSEEINLMIDRVPGVMADTVVRLFARGEAFDSDGFIGFFTDKPMYQFGNGEPCLNKAAIKASVDNFFGAVDALYHDIRNIWEVGDTVFVEMDVIYWRKDGTSIKLPCADIFRFEGNKVLELRIFMDANPIFDRSMIVGDKASVMTISAGKQVTPPGIMKRYFAEHAEGIERVANGFAPKWAIAGPKWPVVSKMGILNAFQAAIGAGDWDLVRSFLTENAVLRVGNRAEVVGPQAVLNTLLNLFTQELRATNANFTGIWEPDDVLVVEMNVQATRLGDGRAVEYPCVETYRFEGPKISEWRIYPIVSTLLAAETLEYGLRVPA